jgi:hypothetical protein
VDAAEIRVRAERRLGETLTAQPKATGGELHLYQCGKQTFNRRLFWNTEGPQMADSRRLGDEIHSRPPNGDVRP